jgi:hypothetical protein
MELQGKSKGVVYSLTGVATLVVLFFVIRALTGYSSDGEESRNRWFVCAQTRKSFKARLEVGMSVPVMSPFSHKATGYPAELCYWKKDGTPKREPTPVLLNRLADPNDNSPTFCPDCGRLVVAHNPPPAEGHAPPTQEEWLKNHGGAAGGMNDLRQ